MSHKIEVIQAYIMVDPRDPSGDESIPAFTNESGLWIPMIASDRTRLEALRGTAQGMARSYGTKITLARFSVRTDLEIIW